MDAAGPGPAASDPFSLATPGGQAVITEDDTMNTWSLDACAPVAATAEQACLAGLIEHLGAPQFEQAGLASINHAVRAGSWSVYRLRPRQTPLLHLSAAAGVPDTTRDCFAAYLGGLYRRDASFDLVRRQRRPGQALVLKMGADEAPTPEHREAIYRRHGVVERLSVAQLEDDGSLLAVNLYRHGGQGAFDPLEQERFVRLAPLLLGGVRRHLQLRAALAGTPLGTTVGPTGASAPGRADSAPAGDTPPSAGAAGSAARQRLQQHCPALTERELDVCERLLRGWSYDGIAADMGLSVATVKTYRARAFDRLGLHFRSELFALIQGSLAH